MPTRPKRPCRYYGCSGFADDGEQFCEAHRKQTEHQYNKYQRDPGTKRMYGRAWKRIRDRQIREHPLCEECLKQGIIKSAEEVHHRLPLADGGTHERSNLVSLCRSCHQKAHVELGTRVPHQ